MCLLFISFWTLFLLLKNYEHFFFHPLPKDGYRNCCQKKLKRGDILPTTFTSLVDVPSQMNLSPNLDSEKIDSITQAGDGLLHHSSPSTITKQAYRAITYFFHQKHHHKKRFLQTILDIYQGLSLFEPLTSFNISSPPSVGLSSLIVAQAISILLAEHKCYAALISKLDFNKSSNAASTTPYKSCTK